jgi:hypothetical protein
MAFIDGLKMLKVELVIKAYQPEYAGLAMEKEQKQENYLMIWLRQVKYLHR